MNQNIFYLIFSLIFLISCKEEEEKIISTDLAIEASQLAKASNAWSEGLFFALIPYDQYTLMQSQDLPGCPKIQVEKEQKLVVLSFDINPTCDQKGKSKRSGKIILDFALADSAVPTWFLEYDLYDFEEVSIDGIRTFSKRADGSVKENFEFLKHATKNGITHQFGGNLLHAMLEKNNLPINVNTSGIISGRNPVGRDFSMDFGAKRSMSFSCFSQNLLTPLEGVERWQVSRGDASPIQYQLTYESKSDCNSDAYLLFPDGKRLLLNP
jgi:hypothetical protein